MELSVTQQVKAAEYLAKAVHIGQVDKSGRGYIHHLRETVSGFYWRYVSAYSTTGLLDDEFKYGTAAAWLHDAVEDTNVTLEMLTGLGFSPRVVELVDLLTRERGVDSETYYLRISKDPIARIIKAADMDSNTIPERLASLPDGTRERLVAKYHKGYHAIGMAPEDRHR